MINKIYVLVIFLSMHLHADSDTFYKEEGINAINRCISVAGDRYPIVEEEITNTYVYYGKYGVNAVTFHKGPMGSFGVRDENSRLVWECLMQQEEIVFLGHPLKDPLFVKIRIEEFELESEDTIEALFKKENGSFNYCCKQPFDLDNIEKNNPGFFENNQ